MAAQKILALAIYLKSTLKDSRLRHYNLNKLSVISNVEYKTLQKYVPLLEQCHFIHYEGSDKNQILVLNSLSSRNKHKNIDINLFDFTSYRGVVESLRAFMVVYIQLRKEKMKRLLDNIHNPRRGTIYKAARRKAKKMVQNGTLNSINQMYEDYGISLERICKELGCSIVTATKAVSYAVDHGWLVKRRNFVQTYSIGVNYYDVEGYTFTTKNNLYNVGANIYSIPPEILMPLLSSSV